MAHTNTHDLRGISTADYSSFIFDRPTGEKTPDGRRINPWYWDVEVVYDATEICIATTTMFERSFFLSQKYSDDQLEVGLWALHGPNLDCSVQHLIWDESASLDTRLEVIASVYPLFRDLLATLDSESAVFMFWDSIAYDFCSGNRYRSESETEERVQDSMFNCLSKILALPHEACQFAALHGIGHLMHPNTSTLLQEYLAKLPANAEALRAYAKEAETLDIQ